MKKIKLIIFHPYSQVGGADNSLKRLMEGLNSKLFSITFISLNKSILKKDLKKKVNFITLQNSRTLFSIPKLRKNPGSSDCSMLRVLDSAVVIFAVTYLLTYLPTNQLTC